MRLLSRMCGGKAFARIRMQDARFRDPPIEQFSHAHPGQSVPLAATDQSSPPQQGQPEPEHMEALKVPRYRVIVEVSLHDRPQPLPGLLDRVMRTIPELLLDFVKLGPDPLTHRFALHHEGAIPFPPADMREAEKVERFGLAFSSSFPVAFSVQPELQQARFIWV